MEEKRRKVFQILQQFFLDRRVKQNQRKCFASTHPISKRLRCSHVLCRDLHFLSARFPEQVHRQLPQDSETISTLVRPSFLTETVLGGELYSTYNSMDLHGKAVHTWTSTKSLYKDLRQENELLTEKNYQKNNNEIMSTTRTTTRSWATTGRWRQTWSPLPTCSTAIPWTISVFTPLSRTSTTTWRQLKERSPLLASSTAIPWTISTCRETVQLHEDRDRRDLRIWAICRSWTIVREQYHVQNFEAGQCVAHHENHSMSWKDSQRTRFCWNEALSVPWTL